MNIEYKIAEYIIIIEFILVVMIVLLTYFLKIFFLFKEKNKNKLIINIENYLIKEISTNNNKIADHFPKKWKYIDILLFILDKFDKQNNIYNWKDYRNHFIHSILFPLARSAVDSRSWTLRFFAAKSFCLASCQQNQKYIIKLCRDSIPLVYLNALSAALVGGVEEAIYIIINRMAKERRLTQSIYLQAFDHVNLDTRWIIEKYLQQSQDPYVRSVCYKTLLKYSIAPLTWDIQIDLKTSNTELKTAAIRFIMFSEKESAIPIVIPYLQDRSWEVRVAVLRCLSDLQANETIKQISICLRDPVWWVRLNAAQTLKNIGKEGVAVLRSQDNKIDRYAFEAAQHVLAIE